MATTATRTERFSGFSDAAIQFLLELQAEQSREWFKAHQADYERLCRRPMELLIVELQQRLADVYPEMADVEPHLFRIQRDTRFSRDKAPYKTNVSAGLAVRPTADSDERHTTPGIHVSFGLDGEYVAFGAWHMDQPILSKYRQLLDDDRTGAEIKSIADELVGRGWTLASMDTLKRVPPPYAQDHPRAELLKRKGLAASIQPKEGISARRTYLDWAEARLREAVPMMGWLDRNLT